MSIVECPVEACLFEGTVASVSDHIVERTGEMHSWGALGYENRDDFCHEVHLEKAHRLQKTGRESRGNGEFQVAVEELEEALWHFQQSEMYTRGRSTITQRCQEVLNLIVAVEAEAKGQPIDELVEKAENAVDAGDETHLEADSDTAAREYEEAMSALKEALALAGERSPVRVQEIERKLRQVQVRRQSLELSELHWSIRDIVAGARDRVAAGDRAFHGGEYETAVNEYEAALDRYESLTGVMEEFSFNKPTGDPVVCDVCRQQYDEEIDAWSIEIVVELLVCPSCTRFGSDGNLPSPREVANEQRSVCENIELIRNGDVGLDWSDEAARAEESDEVASESNNRDTREMLIQLVSLHQQLGAPLTATELDEHTAFGYIEYKNEFGSLSEALAEAGFESC